MRHLRILIIYLLSFRVFASVDPACFTQVQKIGLDMQILGFEGKYVGTSPTNRAVFYNEKLETIYIFEDGLSNPPIEIPWTQATDLRWKDEIKTFSQYKNEGAKSYLTSLGVRCGAGGATAVQHNSAVISNAKASTCTEIGKPFSAVGGKCCEGLTYNPNTRTCDEPSFKDPDLKTCNSDSQCNVGMGCLPKQANIMFTKQSDKEDVIELNSFMRELLDEQMDESEFLESGKSCTHASQCGSYSCEDGKCKEVKVCRFGEEGESVNAGTKCNEAKHLVRGSNGICELSAESKNSLFLGLYDEHTDLFTENENAGQCQFSMSDGVKERTTQALKSIRAMEWLFASISRSDSDDCFQVNKKLRDEIGKPFLQERKHLVQEFSRYYAGIKKDYDTVKAALMSNKDSKVQSQKEVEVHEGEIMPEYELASRQTSGYDTMMFMYRRNLLFQSYEKGMLTNIAGIYDQIANLNKEMANWKDGNTSWSLGDRTVSAFSCSAKYKKLTWRGWKTKRYNNVANRWTDYYEVTGNKELNLNPVTDAQVIEQLKLIGNIEDDDAVLRAFNRKHYLLDPLMPGKTDQNGGLAFTRFGTKKNLRSGGLFGFLKKRDQRKPRYLKGTNTIQSYSGLREDFKARLVQFYKEMKVNNEQTGYIFEPELISTDAVDCVDKMGGELDPDDKCSEFNEFIDDLTDYGMAHFLAYSYHTGSKYSGYFTNAQTWRRKLFNRLEVDLQNLQRYYSEIINIREKQTVCLENLIKHVSNNYLGGGNTLAQGGNNYYDGGDYAGNNNQGAKVAGQIGKLTAMNRSKFSFNAGSSSWKSVADNLVNSNRDNLNSSTQSGEANVSSGSLSTEASAFGRRLLEMKESNQKLSEKGINVAGKNSKFLSSIGSSASAAAPRGASSSSSQGSGIRTSSSGSGFDLDFKDGNSKDLNLESEEKLASIAPGGSSLSNSESGFGGRGGSGYIGEGNIQDSSSSGAGQDGSYQDPTGMSDHEKNIMMSNFERTKGRYNPEEADSLFDVVSKAYVRNLEKVLTRRKKID